MSKFWGPQHHLHHNSFLQDSKSPVTSEDWCNNESIQCCVEPWYENCINATVLTETTFTEDFLYKFLWSGLKWPRTRLEERLLGLSGSQINYDGSPTVLQWVDITACRNGSGTVLIHINIIVTFWFFSNHHSTKFCTIYFLTKVMYTACDNAELWEKDKFKAITEHTVLCINGLTHCHSIQQTDSGNTESCSNLAACHNFQWIFDLLLWGTNWWIIRKSVRWNPMCIITFLKQRAQFLCWNILCTTHNVCKQQHNSYQYLTTWSWKTI
jgi:hypothetical protein